MSNSVTTAADRMLISPHRRAIAAGGPPSKRNSAKLAKIVAATARTIAPVKGVRNENIASMMDFARLSDDERAEGFQFRVCQFQSDHQGRSPDRRKTGQTVLESRHRRRP